MRRSRDLRRLLRWYPPSWRARYGDEFLALLEDRRGDAPFTVRFRASVALAGLRERCYGSGVVGSHSSATAQRRTGTLMVLVAWSIMIVAGAVLVKSAEHFPAALPVRSRFAAEFAYNATAAAGIVGTLLVAAGAVVALPGFVRFLRAGKWSQVRRKFGRSLVASTTLITATVGLVIWAHQLTSAQRNGADTLYSACFLVWALLVVLTIGLWTTTCVAVASRLDFTSRELRWESGLAVGVGLSSIGVITGATLWWVQIGLHAPWFLQGTLAGVATSPWSTQIVFITTPMVLGTVIALWGATRIALTYRPARDHAS